MCFSDSTINGRDGGDDAIRCNGFTTGKDIQHGVGCLESLLEFGANREASKLSGVLESLANAVGRRPAKEATESIVVRVLGGDGAGGTGVRGWGFRVREEGIRKGRVGVRVGIRSRRGFGLSPCLRPSGGEGSDLPQGIRGGLPIHAHG